MKKVLLNFANRMSMVYIIILSMVITFTLWGDTTTTTSIDSFVKSGLSPREAGEWLKLVEKFGIGTALGVFILISTIVPIVRSYVKRTDLLANDINDKISDQNDTLTRLEIKLDASLKGVSGYISKEQTCILMENVLNSLYGSIYIFANTNYKSFNKEVVHKDYEIELMCKQIENFVNNRKNEIKNNIAIFKTQHMDLVNFIEVHVKSSELITILKGFIVEKKTDIESLNAILKDEFDNLINKSNYESR